MSTEPLTPERLAEIRQRAVVTPPWYCVSEIAAWDTSTEPRGTNAAAEWLTVQLNSAYAKGRQHSDVPDLLDEITRLQQFKMAFDEWMKKTEWVQTSELPTRLLGRHRADVMRLEIERLTAALAAVTANRDAVIEHIPAAYRVRVREGCGPENSDATLAVSVANLRARQMEKVPLPTN